uniref:Uncharacterized protein n=1 Tax=Arundo donax TaxID=35708 RepID=A0A0A8YYV9_ARUDO
MWYHGNRTNRVSTKTTLSRTDRFKIKASWKVIGTAQMCLFQNIFICRRSLHEEMHETQKNCYGTRLD